MGSSATQRAPNLFNRLKILGLRPCRCMSFARDLPVRPGVRDSRPIDPDVLFIVESNEFPAGELRAIVCDDGVWYSKMMDDVEEE